MWTAINKNHDTLFPYRVARWNGSVFTVVLSLYLEKSAPFIVEVFMFLPNWIADPEGIVTSNKIWGRSGLSAPRAADKEH